MEHDEVTSGALTEDESGVLAEEDLLLELVKSIVRMPDKVSVDVARGKQSTLLTISVDPSDRGHVIGKSHETLNAINHLFNKAAYLDGERSLMIQLEGHQPRVAPSQGQGPNRHYRPGGHGQQGRPPWRNNGPVREYRRSRNSPA